MSENLITTNFIYVISSNFVTISHINYWDQVNSWKNLWKLLNGPLCGNKSGPFPLLNVAAYWQSSDTEACAEKLSQILADNIDNGGGGLVSEFMWCIAYGALLLQMALRTTKMQSLQNSVLNFCATIFHRLMHFP